MFNLRRIVLMGSAFASAFAFFNTIAWAEYTTTSPLLPAPVYDHTVPPRKCFPTAQPVCVDSFFDVFPDFQRAPGPLPGTQRIDSFFDIFTELTLDDGNGPQTYRGDAQMAIATTAHPSPPPGTQIFDTEMLQLDLSGGTLPLGWMIRESPTLPSQGQTTITDIGGGLYHIDSFFDVFTELSIDGGQNWTPYDGAMHVEGVPEPGTLGLLFIGGLAVLKRRRRA